MNKLFDFFEFPVDFDLSIKNLIKGKEITLRFE